MARDWTQEDFGITDKTPVLDIGALKQENMKLKKQLEIAEKALEEYAKKDLWDDCYVEDFVNSHPKCAFYSDGYKIAEDALFEIKLIKKDIKR